MTAAPYQPPAFHTMARPNQSPEDAERDRVLLRMLKTPPKPHKPLGTGKRKKRTDIESQKSLKAN